MDLTEIVQDVTSHAHVAIRNADKQHHQPQFIRTQWGEGFGAKSQRESDGAILVWSDCRHMIARSESRDHFYEHDDDIL